MDVYRELIDSKVITDVLGVKSDIYIQSIKTLEDQIKVEKLFEESFSKWKRIFSNIYGSQIKSELFFKHTYFAQVLKVIVIFKLTINKNLTSEEIYNEYCKNDLKHIFEWDFFFWTKLNEKIFRKIVNEFQDLKFAEEDLFSSIYQQIFLPEIRHRIGEFFTPSNLVQKMVDDVYKLGSKVMDPSCGSGNFLINIIIKILDSKEPIK
ncbi:MAG: N-6 DNA methylase, partial [Promethearchaeota archaeon]